MGNAVWDDYSTGIITRQSYTPNNGKSWVGDVVKEHVRHPVWRNIESRTQGYRKGLLAYLLDFDIMVDIYCQAPQEPNHWRSARWNSTVARHELSTVITW